LGSAEIRRRHAEVIERCRQIVTQAAAEGREINGDEQALLANLESEAASLLRQAELVDTWDKRSEEARQSAGRVSKPTGPHNDPNCTRDHMGNPRRYSICRAASLVVDGRLLDGIEAEVNAEARRGLEREPVGQITVPWDLPWDFRSIASVSLSVARRIAFLSGLQFRDLDTTTGAGAVATVTPPTLIDVLRAKMVMADLGAPILSGLQGKFSLPRKTAGTGFAWIAEGSAATPGQPNMDAVAIEPKSVIGSSVVSRKFMKQTSLDPESTIRMDLMDGLAVEIDRVGLNGSGSGAQPRGILQTAAVTTVAFGTNGALPTWAKMVEFEQVVENANGLMGSLAYVTTPNARGRLKITERATNTARFIWADDQTINGYQALATSNMPSNLVKGTSGTVCSGAIFGNFEDALFGLWGGIDLLVNPYSGDTAGSVKFTLIQDADFAIRRAGSFARALDILTA
jgi:HK97 family phage major capsid protein